MTAISNESPQNSQSAAPQRAYLFDVELFADARGCQCRAEAFHMHGQRGDLGSVCGQQGLLRLLLRLTLGLRLALRLGLTLVIRG